MTAGLVLLPIATVGVVLAWAESRAGRRAAAVGRPLLTGALLAGGDDDVPTLLAPRGASAEGCLEPRN